MGRSTALILGAALLSIGLLSVTLSCSIVAGPRTVGVLGSGTIAIYWERGSHALPVVRLFARRAKLSPGLEWRLLPSRTLYRGMGAAEIPVFFPALVGAGFCIYVRRWLPNKGYPPGCCRFCGYCLNGAVFGVCPECGALINRTCPKT